MKYSFFLLIMCKGLPIFLFRCYQAAHISKKLYDNLLNSFDPHTRPEKFTSESVLVYVDLYKILDLDEKRGTITVKISKAGNSIQDLPPFPLQHPLNTPPHPLKAQMNATSGINHALPALTSAFTKAPPPPPPPVNPPPPLHPTHPLPQPSLTTHCGY